MTQGTNEIGLNARARHPEVIHVLQHLKQPPGERGRPIESGLNCTTRDLALCITYALRGFKEMAFDSNEFRRLIRIQVRLVVGAVSCAAPPST